MPNPDGSLTPEELDAQRRIIALPTRKLNTEAILPAVKPVGQPTPFSAPEPMGPSSSLPGMRRPPDENMSPTGFPMYKAGANVPATGIAPPPNQLSQDQERLNQESNWKFGSKIGNPFARGLLRGLDVLGSTIAPQFMWAIPGTTPHHLAQMNEARHAVAGDVAEQEREAQTAAAQAEIPLREAQVKHTEAETAALGEGKETPTDKVVHSYVGADNKEHEVLQSQKDGSLYERVMGEVTSKETAPKSEQQFADEYHTLHPNATVAETQRAYRLNQELPQRPPQVMVMVPAPGGGQTAQVVRPGQTVAPGAVTPAGMSSENVPTSATRTMAEAAPKVLMLADRVEKLVNQQAKTLGPAASRWNEFMAGKVGAPNPEFTKLRTDVGLLSTLLMRMHVGARGGEYIMKHFQDLMDSGKQSPENMLAAITEIKQYAQDVQAEAKGTTGAAPQATPAQQTAPKGQWNPKTGRYE